MAKTKYVFIKVPDEDMDLLMRTILWDDSRQLPRSIEKAMSNIEYISEPWVVFSLASGTPAHAHIFLNEESAKSYLARHNQNMNLVCIKAEFISEESELSAQVDENLK